MQQSFNRGIKGIQVDRRMLTSRSASDWKEI